MTRNPPLSSLLDYVRIPLSLFSFLFFPLSLSRLLFSRPLSVFASLRSHVVLASFAEGMAIAMMVVGGGAALAATTGGETSTAGSLFGYGPISGR